MQRFPCPEGNMLSRESVRSVSLFITLHLILLLPLQWTQHKCSDGFYFDVLQEPMLRCYFKHNELINNQYFFLLKAHSHVSPRRIQMDLTLWLHTKTYTLHKSVQRNSRQFFNQWKIYRIKTYWQKKFHLLSKKWKEMKFIADYSRRQMLWHKVTEASLIN